MYKDVAFAKHQKDISFIVNTNNTQQTLSMKNLKLNTNFMGSFF